MYRVELKQTILYEQGTNNIQVANVPCGVETHAGLKYRGSAVMLLMYRVESKCQILAFVDVNTLVWG